MTTRREMLQSLIVSIGGASMLNACGGVARVAPTDASSARFYTEAEWALVARISDLIIPRTDTPGALDVNIPGFLDGLMAEWANADTRRQHRRQLVEMERRWLGRDFTSLDQGSAESRLAVFDAQAFTGRPASHAGYRSLKALITQAYFASEEGALQEQGWVAVPGRWDACVEIR